MKKKIIVFLNTAITITVITLISKIFGFLREVALANKLGVSEISDSFLLATSFPQILYTSFILAIGINFIPVYISIKNSNEASFFYKTLQKSFFILSTIVFFIFWILKDFIVSIFSPGSELKFIESTSNYALISMVSILFIGYINISISKFNTNNKPLISAVSPIVTSLFTIVAFIIFDKKHIEEILWMIVISYILQFIGIKYYLEKDEEKYKINNRDAYLKSKKNIILLYKRAIPTMLSTYVDQLLPFFERFFASYMIIGSLTYLNYSHRLNGLLLGIVGSLIISLFYPSLTKSIHKSLKERSQIIYRTLLKIIIFSVPLTLYMMYNSEKIVSFLFKSGLFDEADVKVTSQIFMIFLVGGFFNIIRSFINTIFFSNMNTKDPFISSLVMISMFLVLLNILKETVSINIITLSIVEVFSFFSALLYICYKSIKLKYFKISLSSILLNLLLTILLFILTQFIFKNIIFDHIQSIKWFEIKKINLGIELFLYFIPCILSIYFNLKLVRDKKLKLN